MTRIRLLALMLALALCLTACGAAPDQGETKTTKKTTTTTETVEDTTNDGTANTTVVGVNTTTTTTTKKNDTTTSYTKNVQGGIVHTTEAPTTTKDKSAGKAIKILAVGNSFSVDAMNNHLFPILESAGYTDITLGNLYIGGCSLNTHYANLRDNLKAYRYYCNTDGIWTATEATAASSAFGKTKWDVVTIQQVSSDSGRPATYTNLASVVAMIKQSEPQAKILWHMTWAYQQDSPHDAFPYYNKDQMTMYHAIVQTVQDQVLPLATINGVIPAGTAIQNLRTSALGDTLTSDGHHLLDSYGDYTAALTWFCTITGEKPQAVSYRPGAVAAQWDAIAAAVENAIKTPYAVTPLT